MKCPHCGKDVERQGNPAFPFCSARCKTIDLGAWLTEDYRVPGPPVEGAEVDELASSDDEMPS